MKKRGDEFVYLDITHKPESEIKEHFPNIYERCLMYGIDITREMIPVVPAMHYSCGGVATDLFARTTINRLYACGEVACTGVHGANRLASNSLLEALVFSHRAFLDMRENLKSVENNIAFPDWDESGTENPEEWILISHNRKEVQQVMNDYVGIVRSDLRLKRAERRIAFSKKKPKPTTRKLKFPPNSWNCATSSKSQVSLLKVP
jgi:L-aspartate oxidase (EC 1.4.3.16)